MRFQTRYGIDDWFRIRVEHDFPGAIFGLQIYKQPMFWYILIPNEIDILL